MRRAVLVSALLCALFFTAPAQGVVGLEQVGNFERPVYVTGAPGDGERLYVVEQRGIVKVIRNGTVSTFLDVRDQVWGPDDPRAGSEEGLLSIAFAPDFPTSRLLYLYYTELYGQNNLVVEMRAPTGDAADPTSRRMVAWLPHRDGTHHNGGQLQFGPDGRLYVATGDGGTGGGPARDLASPLGKILRIDPRGDLPGFHRTPSTNPFFGLPKRDERVWAYGLRNPFRFSFDRLSGDMVIADVGEKAIEEIDHLPFAKGYGYGADLGWNACEGSYATGTTRPCPIAGAVKPAIEHSHADGYRAIVGGYVVRDPSLPSLRGRYLYGDFYVDELRSALLGPGGASDDRGAGVAIPRLTSFGEDSGGCIYATSYLGQVYRLVEEDRRVPCAPAASAAPADTRQPRLYSDVTRTQRMLRRDGAAIYVRSDEGGRVWVKGTLETGRTEYVLRTVTRTLTADRRSRVEVRLTLRARDALRRALARGDGAWMTLIVNARDLADNPASGRLVTVRARP